MNKKCPKCRKNKPHSEFGIDRKSKLGISSYCKICDDKRKKLWLRNNAFLISKNSLIKIMNLVKEGREEEVINRYKL